MNNDKNIWQSFDLAVLDGLLNDGVSIAETILSKEEA
jgi:hypothetical protein